MHRRPLESIKLFAGLDQHELDRCADACDEVEVLTGEKLAREGEYGYKFFVVLTGRVTVAQDGNVVADLGPGDYFGEMSLLAAGRRNADVIATERSTLARMMLWDFRKLTDDMPTLAEAIDTTVAERMAAVHDD